MKKKLVSLLALVALLLPLTAMAENVQCLVLTESSGAVSKFALTDAPVVTYSGSDMVVTCGDQTLTVGLEGLTLTYDEMEVTGIDVVKDSTADPDRLQFAFGEANFEGLQSGALVSVYSIDGKMITHADGSKTEIQTSDVKNIQYVQQLPYEADANVDQIVIKELYNGGCPKDEGTGAFSNDKCIVLYNNCPQKAVVNNLCIAFASPYNGHASNKNYTEDGKLTYEAEGFTPAFGGMWWYPYSLIIEPYSQVVINVSGAIDNTQTYSQSVNYAHGEYYCMYDPESGFANTGWYPTPASVIPTSHYLKAKRLGTSNAWALSNSSPAVFIFQTKGVAPADFAENADNLWYDGGDVKDINACLKVANDWIIDGLEVYQKAKISNSNKRLTAAIDAGFVGLTNQLGHTLYRNVDKEATEALSENAGKLVYNYALGVDDSTDPSGIDAEASIKNGAHIVYMDTNNSTNDFHERQKCSLRN